MMQRLDGGGRHVGGAGAWGVGVDQPVVARMCDHLLGGAFTFDVDRCAAEQLRAVFPQAAWLARAERAFLAGAVGQLHSIGVRQFLDLGAGLPGGGSLHELTRTMGETVRVVHVDCDPVAVAVTVNRLRSAGTLGRTATAVQADLRFPEAVFTDPVVGAVLDLRRPVGVILSSVLQYLTDGEAVRLVGRLRAGLAAGSVLAVSHPTFDGLAAQVVEDVLGVFRRTPTPVAAVRDRAGVAALFAGQVWHAPGLVDIMAWLDDVPALGFAVAGIADLRVGGVTAVP